MFWIQILFKDIQKHLYLKPVRFDVLNLTFLSFEIDI